MAYRRPSGQTRPALVLPQRGVEIGVKLAQRRFQDDGTRRRDGGQANEIGR